MYNLIPENIIQIRVALVGLGKMGQIHLSALGELKAGRSEKYYKGDVSSLFPRLNICALVDPKNPDISEDLQSQLTPSIQEAINRKPHLAIVASPTSTHFDYAKCFLEKGIHTLVEKPVVTTAQELRYLIDLASKNGCRLMAGHVERYNPVAVKLVSFLKGVNRKNVCYHFVRAQPHPSRIPDDIITDKVIHDLDLSLYFFGKISSARLEACTIKDNQPYEATVKIRHISGAEGAITVSWLPKSSTKQRTVDISSNDTSTKSWTCHGDFVQKVLLVNGQNEPCHVDGMIEPINNQIRDELVDFLAWSSEWKSEEERVAPLLSTEEILHATEILESIRSQAH